MCEDVHGQHVAWAGAEMLSNECLRERHGCGAVGGAEGIGSRHGGSPGGVVGVRGGKEEEYEDQDVGEGWRIEEGLCTEEQERTRKG